MLTKETCQLLREPTFDNWQWEDEEMLLLLQQMYLDLELPRKFDIEINILRNFLVNVYHHYNDVPFHNFRHCFCVTQMVSESKFYSLYLSTLPPFRFHFLLIGPLQLWRIPSYDYYKLVEIYHYKLCPTCFFQPLATYGQTHEFWAENSTQLNSFHEFLSYEFELFCPFYNSKNWAWVDKVMAASSWVELELHFDHP